MKSWIRSWLFRKQEENDLAEELRAHMKIEEHQLVEAGEAPDEASRAARRVLGNTARMQEAVRETWGWSGIERSFEDLRYGLRMLRKTPAWTSVICLTRALGIGLSTVIFSVVYSVLLQPLPYPDADRIMALWPSARKTGYSRFNVNAALWLHWRKDSTLFEDMALTRPIANFNLTGDGEPERFQGARTSFNLPLVLGVRPLLGRTFTEEEQRNDAKVAILSHGFWRRGFAGDPEILGRKIQLNGEPFEVIGIMPPEYRYPSADFELWTPLYIPPDEIRDGYNYQYIAVGRLKRGVSVAQAQTEISAIMQRLSQEYPASYGTSESSVGALVEPL